MPWQAFRCVLFKSSNFFLSQMWTFTIPLKGSRTAASLWGTSLDLGGLWCGPPPFDKQNLRPFKDHCILTQQHLMTNYSFPQIWIDHLYNVDNVLFYRILFKIETVKLCSISYRWWWLKFYLAFFISFYNLKNSITFVFMGDDRVLVREKMIWEIEATTSYRSENNSVYHYFSRGGWFILMASFLFC